MDSTVDAVRDVIGAIEYYALVHAGGVLGCERDTIRQLVAVREYAARPRKGQRKEELLGPAIVEHHVESNGRSIFGKVKGDRQKLGC
jgi:hypothetical protein